MKEEDLDKYLGKWGMLESEFLDKKPVSGAFDLKKLEKFLSDERSRKLDSEGIHRTIAFSQANFKVRYKSRFYRTEEVHGWNCGDLARISSWNRMRVKCEWDSDALGDWETNSGPKTTGIITNKTKIKQGDNYERISESLELELWNGIGDIPTCRVKLNAKYNIWEDFTLTRKDYFTKFPGLIRVPFVRDFMWEVNEKYTENLPTEAFLRGWAIERYLNPVKN